jgi:hypothetical protein
MFQCLVSETGIMSRCNRKIQALVAFAQTCYHIFPAAVAALHQEPGYSATVNGIL